jgi:serine/threonine-protein kinase RsbW
MWSRPLGISDPGDPITRTFPGRYSSLSRIGEFVRTQARSSGLDDTAIYQVEMAVDEACSNIIEHAYGGEGNGEIGCTCQCNPEGLAVILKDNGRPFEPEKTGAPDLEAGLEDRESHGLGLFFIREWMDRVQFEFSPVSGNTLTMFKSKTGKKTRAKK